MVKTKVHCGVCGPGYYLGYDGCRHNEADQNTDRLLRTYKSVLDLHPRHVEGRNPSAMFELDSGAHIVVIHHGDHLEVRNTGDTTESGLSFVPCAGSEVEVRTCKR